MFPMQQGDLDWLCSAYAFINLLALRKSIETPQQADDKFVSMMEFLLAAEWNFARYITEGVDPSLDVEELALAAGFSIPISIDPQKLHTTVSENRGPVGFLIYICEEKATRPFSHYTIITHARKNGGFDLYDSYGFKRIISNGRSYELDESGIQIGIIAAWRIDQPSPKSLVHKKKC